MSAWKGRPTVGAAVQLPPELCVLLVQRDQFHVAELDRVAFGGEADAAGRGGAAGGLVDDLAVDLQGDGVALRR